MYTIHTRVLQTVKAIQSKSHHVLIILSIYESYIYTHTHTPCIQNMNLTNTIQT